MFTGMCIGAWPNRRSCPGRGPVRACARSQSGAIRLRRSAAGGTPSGIVRRGRVARRGISEGARHSVPEANLRMARPDPQAVPVLDELRGRGIKTAIVSNTPWGSSAHDWRAELNRHGLLDKVDATVFCMDVEWRKPHRAPFDRALSLLEVAPADALFVGDDHRWDVVGAQNAGLRPILLEAVVPTSRRDHLTIPNLAGIVALLTEASL